MVLMLLAAKTSRRLKALSVVSAILPSIEALPISTDPRHLDSHEKRHDEQILLGRSEVKSLTGIVVGTTVAVGVFILVLLFIAVYVYRRKLFRLAGHESQGTSPRTHLYRGRDRNRASRSRKAIGRGERRTKRSSSEKKRTRSTMPKQPSSTAASIASSFTPAHNEHATAPEMARIISHHSDPTRFRPPVQLPPLITQPQQLQSPDATVSSAFHPSRASRWSMSTLGMNLLADTMTNPDPERYGDTTPSSRYQNTTPSAYGPSPVSHEGTPTRSINLIPVELPSCYGQSTSSWYYNPSPETPVNWGRVSLDDSLATPVAPRRLNLPELDHRQLTAPLNTIPEDAESLRQSWV